MKELQDGNPWSIFVLTGIPVTTNKIYYREIALVKHHPTGKSVFYVLQPLQITSTICQ
jgi:hypothetical protein